MCFPQFYVKPRLGALFNASKAAKLQAMLESSIQRRFPRGLKVHVHSVDRFGCLAQLTRTLKDAGLSITRAKVGGVASLCDALRLPRSTHPMPAQRSQRGMSTQFAQTRAFWCIDP